MLPGKKKQGLLPNQIWTHYLRSKWFHIEPIGCWVLSDGPCGFIWEKSATGGSQYDSHSVVGYAEVVGKDNFKMACKDDRIWTKFLLFIYAKICVNVKCHFHHALFMVWLFSLGGKKAACWFEVFLWLQHIATGKWVMWRTRTLEQAPAQAYLVWARVLTLLAWSDFGRLENALLVI